MAPSDPLRTSGAYEAPAAVVFEAAIETVRSLPGWEVLTAHPETGEIHVRSKGRLFSPSLEHVMRLSAHGIQTNMELESRATRTIGTPDPDTVRLFATLLADRIAARAPHVT